VRLRLFGSREAVLRAGYQEQRHAPCGGAQCGAHQLTLLGGHTRVGVAVHEGPGAPMSPARVTGERAATPPGSQTAVT
jgi:hypothetical protein